MKENMNDKKDSQKLFGNLDDNTVEKIAARYPVGGEEGREKVFRRIEKLAGDSKSEGEEIRGVEAYRPRPYLRVVSAAAAIALVAGAAVGGGFLLNRKGSSPSKSLPAAEASETVTVSDEEEENFADNLLATGTVDVSGDETEIETETAEWDGEEAPSEASHTPVVLSREELITKVLGKSYEDFDRVYMEIETDHTEMGHCSIVMKSDHTTGADSVVSKWDFNDDYLENCDFPENLFASVAEYNCNGVFVRTIDFLYDVNDNVYTAQTLDSFIEEQNGEQGATYRRNVSGVFEPEAMYRQYVESAAFEVTGGCEYLGRECTVAGVEPEDDKGWSVTVDNETGIILKGEWTLEGEVYETFAVTDLRFGEDAEPVEDGSYILSRIEGYKPTDEATKSFDLSPLGR